MSKNFDNHLPLTESLKGYLDRQQHLNDESVSVRSIDESDRFDTLVLVYISDLHIGTPDLDLNWLVEVVEYVMNTPNAKVLLLGDLLNTAILNAVSNMFEDLAYPQEQWQIAVDLFSGLAKQNKIITICAGNHERRVHRQTGIDITGQFATAIKAQDSYAPYYANRKIILKSKDSKSGKFTLPIVTHHGDGVSDIAGVKKLQDIDSGSYINTVGHLHRQQMRVRSMQYYDPSTGKKYKKSVLDVILPSAGGGYYAKEKMLKDNYKSPYLALEITTCPNPRYEKFKNAEWKEEKIIPAIRTIPIMQAADTADKNIYIQTATKAIKKKEREKQQEFLIKIADLVKWMRDQGVEIKNEVKNVLKTKIKEENEKKPQVKLSLKRIDDDKEETR